MGIGEIKNVNSQMVSQYEKNTGAGGVDPRGRGEGQPVGKNPVVATSPEVKVDFSAKSQDFVQIKNAVNQLPEVREDKVRELKTQIDNGTYNVDSTRVADKMVRESLLDIFA